MQVLTALPPRAVARTAIAGCVKMPLRASFFMEGGLDLEIVWLIAIVVFIVLEAVTYQMLSIWFIGGAICGLVAKMLGAQLWLQMTIFVAVSVVQLVAFRPFAIKRLKTDCKTKADAAIGRKIIITKEVNNMKGTGEAMLDGLIWSVRSDDDSIIAEGETVEVKKIEGVKLIV